MFSPDESETVGFDGVKERLKLFKEFRQSLLNSLRAVAKSSGEPIPCIPCPVCLELHIDFDLFCGRRRSVIRCQSIKIPPDYYSDFREIKGL